MALKTDARLLGVANLRCAWRMQQVRAHFVHADRRKVLARQAREAQDAEGQAAHDAAAAEAFRGADRADAAADAAAQADAAADATAEAADAAEEGGGEDEPVEPAAEGDGDAAKASALAAAKAAANLRRGTVATLDAASPSGEGAGLVVAFLPGRADELEAAVARFQLLLIKVRACGGVEGGPISGRTKPFLSGRFKPFLVSPSLLRFEENTHICVAFFFAVFVFVCALGSRFGALFLYVRSVGSGGRRVGQLRRERRARAGVQRHRRDAQARGAAAAAQASRAARPQAAPLPRAIDNGLRVC